MGDERTATVVQGHGETVVRQYPLDNRRHLGEHLSNIEHGCDGSEELLRDFKAQAVPCEVPTESVAQLSEPEGAVAPGGTLIESRAGIST